MYIEESVLWTIKIWYRLELDLLGLLYLSFFLLFYIKNYLSVVYWSLFLLFYMKDYLSGGYLFFFLLFHMKDYLVFTARIFLFAILYEKLSIWGLLIFLFSVPWSKWNHGETATYPISYPIFQIIALSCFINFDLRIGSEWK